MAAKAPRWARAVYSAREKMRSLSIVGWKVACGRAGKGRAGTLSVAARMSATGFERTQLSIATSSPVLLSPQPRVPLTLYQSCSA